MGIRRVLGYKLVLEDTGDHYWRQRYAGSKDRDGEWIGIGMGQVSQSSDWLLEKDGAKMAIVHFAYKVSYSPISWSGHKIVLLSLIANLGKIKPQTLIDQTRIRFKTNKLKENIK